MIRFQDTNSFLRSLLTMPLTDEVFAVLATSEHMDLLRLNPHLSETQWDALWEKNLPVALAEHLAGHVLNQDQLARFLKDEKRGSVLVHQFRAKGLTPDQKLNILMTAKGSQYVYPALASGDFDPQHLEAASRHFRGVERLEWITLRGSLTVSDAEALEALAYFDTDQGLRHLRSIVYFTDAVHRLIGDRPQLVDGLCAMEKFIPVASLPLSSSRWLHKPEHHERIATEIGSTIGGEILAFVSNPVVSIEYVKRFADHKDDRVKKTVASRIAAHGDTVLTPHFDQIEDLNDIEWVLRRSLPTETRYLGRPHDLVVLAQNPNLHRSQAARIHATLSKIDLDTERSFSFRMSAYDAAMDALTDRFNLPRPPKVAELGFWDRLMSGNTGVWYNRYSFDPEFALSAENRPWDEATVTDAYHKIPADHMARIESGDLSPWNLPAASAHVYLVHHLGNNPRSWQLVASLAPKHLGSLSKLVSAAKRLSK